MMIDHVFKRDNADGKCAVCESSWPPAGDTISDYIRCQKCDQVVHGSCKRISSMFLSCSDKHCRRVKTKDGILAVRLRQISGTNCSTGMLLYALFKIQALDLAMRTDNTTVHEREASWMQQQSDAFEVDFAGNLNYIMRVEIWNSYYEILDKMYYKVDIDLLPATNLTGKRYERWFPLEHVSDRTEKARVLLEFCVIPRKVEDITFPIQLSGAKEEQAIPLVSSLTSSTSNNSISPTVTPGLNDTQLPMTSNLAASTKIDTSPKLLPDENSSLSTIDLGKSFHVVTSTDNESSIKLLEVDRDRNQGNESLNKNLFNETKDSISAIFEDNNLPGGNQSSVTVGISTTSVIESKISLTKINLSMETTNNVFNNEQDSMDSQILMNAPQREVIGISPDKSTDVAHLETHVVSDPEEEVPPNHDDHDDLINMGHSILSNISDISGILEENNDNEDSKILEQQILKELEESVSKPEITPIAIATKNVFEQPNSESVTSSSISSSTQLSIPSVLPSSGDYSDGALSEVTNDAIPEVNSFSIFVTDTFSRLGNLFYELETSLVESKPASVSPEEDMNKVDKMNIDDNNLEENVGIMTINILNLELFEIHQMAEKGYNIHIQYVTKLGKKKSFKKTLHRMKGSWISKEPLSVQVPFFRCFINIDVIDIATERVVGHSKVTAYEVSQRNSDYQLNSTAYGPFNMLLLKDDKSKRTVGRLDCQLLFQEDLYKHFWSPLVKLSPSSPEEELSLDRLGVHLIRFRAMIDFFGKCYTEYLRIMDWSDPLFTSTLFLLFLYCTLYVRAEYSLSGVMFALVLLMGKTWYNRYSGKYKEKYLSGYLQNDEQPYIPVSTLKISVLGYRSSVKTSTPLSTIGFGFLSNASSTSSNTTSANNVNEVTYLSNALAAVKVSLVPDRTLIDTPSEVDATNSNGVNNNNNINATNASQSQELDAYSSATTTSNSTIPNITNPSTANASTTTNASNNNSSNNSNLVNLISSSSTKDLPIGVISTSEEHLQMTEEASAAGVAQFVSSFMKVSSDTGNKLDIITNTFEPWHLCDVTTLPTMLHANPHSVRTSSSEIALVYPLLQPIKRKQDLLKEKTVSNINEPDRRSPQKPPSASKKFVDNPAERDHAYYSTWTTSSAAVKFTWIPSSTFSSFLDQGRNEHAFLPIRDILLHGEQIDKTGVNYEYCTWIRAGGDKSINSSEKIERSLNYDSADFNEKSFVNSSKSSGNNNMAQNELLVRVAISLPPLKRLLSPTIEDRKVSEVLQGIQFGRGSHSDMANNKDANSGSSTLTVLWNMRDHVKHAQNIMAWILDIFESFKNLFNWTSPIRTLPIFLALVIMWLLTIFIPGRFLVLLLGLYEFLYIILPIPDGDEIFIRFQNLLQSIPNDDDLMDIYAEERQRRNAALEKAKKDAQRTVLLNVSLRVRWMGNVQVKILRRLVAAGKASGVGVTGVSTTTSLLLGGSSDWSSAWLLVQGKRLAWWQAEEDMDRGKLPMGQLLIGNVAGFTQVSPVDLKRFVGHGGITGIFGEDILGKPLQIVVHVENMEAMTLFKAAVAELIQENQ